LNNKNDTSQKSLSEEERLEIIDVLNEKIRKLKSIRNPKFKDLKELLNLKLNLAYFYSSFDEYLVEALNEFISSEEIMQRLNASNQEFAAVKGSIASIYFLLGDFESSAKYYEQALNLADDFNIKEKITSKKGLGLSLIQLNKFEEGVNNLIEAAELCVDINDVDTYMEIITILKIHFRQRNQWDMILELEKKALKILENLDNKREIAYSYIEIGIALSKLQRYKEALANFKKAVNIAIVESDNELIYKGILLVAESYFQLKELDKAREEYLKALSMAAFLNLEEEINKTKIILKALNANDFEIEKAINKGKNERQNLKKNAKYPKRIKT